MKLNYCITGFLCFLLCFNCEKPKALSVSEKIAKANGIEHWENVNEIKFTFRLDQDTIIGHGRSWIWNPKKNKVTLNSKVNPISYSTQKIDSSKIAIDRAFINDKFWVLFPFQLVWDKNTTISEPKKAQSPIHNKNLNLITVTYPKVGGYTPGDAYDVYYNDDFRIEEWSFRQQNKKEPTLSNTFENYKTIKGITIATDHRIPEKKWNLNISEIEIN